MKNLTPIFLMLIHCFCYAQSGQNTFIPNYDTIKNISFLTDQDVSTAYNEDRNYTMGLGLVYTDSRHMESNYLVIPLLRKGLDRLFGVRKMVTNQYSNYVSSLSFLGSGFTPLDIDNPDPIFDDRPYASITVLGSDRVNVFNTEISLDDDSGESSLPIDDGIGDGLGDEIDVSSVAQVTPKRPFAISTAFYIGFLGLDIANKVQSHIHENHWLGSTRPVPLGWGNQISNGGELTAMYSISVSSPIFTISHPSKPSFKLFESTIDFGPQLGYYTNLSMGINMKFGLFDEEFWTNLSRTNAVSQAPVIHENQCWRWYVYASVRTRYVVYNALLQGQFKESVHTLRREDISPFIIESEFGLSLNYKNRFTLIYKPIVLRTAEFLIAKRDHIWGNFSLSYSFN